MADGAERQNAIEPGVYDPRRDANWQARLEEARAKREIALREKRGSSRPKKRLKPWEEEGAAVLDDDADVTPQHSGLEFSDRVDAMRTRSAPAQPEVLAQDPDHTPVSERPGANWTLDCHQNVLPMPPRSRPEPEPDPDVELAAEEQRKPVSSVNDIFADPVFQEPVVDPDPDVADPETIPIALLRVPPPEPVRRRMQAPEEDPAETEPEVEAVAPTPAPAGKVKAKRHRSNLWAIAALFAGAIAIGPIYKFTQPIERGPLVFTLSSFPIEPAFGLTSPMFEMPAQTRSREWTPASLSPSDEPLVLARPNVPERARELADFAIDPAFGAEVSGILIGLPLAALPDTPVGQPLPVVLPERPISVNGQVTGLASALTDIPIPAARPVAPANG